MRPNYKKLDNGKAVLLSAYNLVIHPLPLTRLHVTVPDGFRWDGASVPLPARWLIGDPFADEFLVPSLIHDWYCDQVNTTISRTISDAVFWELLRMERVPRWKRFAMWCGVRLYSLFVWRLWLGWPKRSPAT